MKSKANVNVYLMLFKDEKLLLSLRHNTGYEDGKWALVSGHVEENESAKQALSREAREEIGIEIDPNNLNVHHIMHRKTNRENIDIFMSCTEWKNEVQNKEQNKCGGLEFFDLEKLPDNTIEYIKNTIDYSKKKQFYSELDW